jgi:hypothetical protein
VGVIYVKNTYEVTIKTRIVGYSKSLEEKLEKAAFDFVAEHARFHKGANPGCEYSVRYPLTSSTLIFSSDTMELKNLVKEKMRKRSQVN